MNKVPLHKGEVLTETSAQARNFLMSELLG